MDNFKYTLDFLGRHIAVIREQANAGDELCQAIIQDFLAVYKGYEFSDAASLIERVSAYRKRQFSPAWA